MPKRAIVEVHGGNGRTKLEPAISPKSPEVVVIRGGGGEASDVEQM
jgi:hypothetical protein